MTDTDHNEVERLLVENAALRRRVDATEAVAIKRERRLQTAMAAGGIIGTWTWHPLRDAFTVDENFARSFGTDPALAYQDLTLNQVLATVHPEDRPGLDTAIADALARGGPYAHSYRVRRADRQYYWIEANGRVNFGPDGEPDSFPGILIDLDERRSLEVERDRSTAQLRIRHDELEQRVAERTAKLMQAEEQLRQSQKMEAIGQLTGGVAHDFNNLLTVIKSATEMLKRGELPEERRSRYVTAISDTADRAAKLTGQLLAFARRQALKPEVFVVCDSVLALSDMMGTLTGSRIEIVTDLTDKVVHVNADHSQFDTALVNIAANARDAMDGTGQLTISVRPVDQLPAIRNHAVQPGAFVAIAVSDTGTGIAADKLDRIFEPFYTTKDMGKGTGLGLSQVFGFAKQSGGEVTVESEVGRGTIVTLYLPRVAGEDYAGNSIPEPEPLPAGHGTCVLVVEDNTDVGTFAVQTLADLGYSTVLATNAEEALAELERDATRFDVVFSDVVMPGMSGIELGQAIRARYHDLPVVLTSGYSHVLAQNGTYGFELLHKPYSIEQLSRILRKVATWQRRRRILDA